jgi:hypothetical protein
VRVVSCDTHGVHAESAGVIFRGNTLATKCVDAFMKLIGSSYLHQVLKEHVAAISEDKKSCEVDPSKVEKGENVGHNMTHLRETAEKITEDIFASADLVPAYAPTARVRVVSLVVCVCVCVSCRV